MWGDVWSRNGHGLLATLLQACMSHSVLKGKWITAQLWNKVQHISSKSKIKEMKKEMSRLKEFLSVSVLLKRRENE